jgi:mannose-6-phosphate isomerase class I
MGKAIQVAKALPSEEHKHQASNKDQKDGQHSARVAVQTAWKLRDEEHKASCLVALQEYKCKANASTHGFVTRDN